MSKKYGYIASIGVDTSGVVTALKDVEQNTKNISVRIKAINEGLKFDSKSPVLLAQKYDAISEQVDNTRKKLEALKSVEQQAEAARQRGDMSKEKYAIYNRTIASTEANLKLYNAQLANAKIQLEQAQEALDKTAYATKGLGGTLEELDGNEKEFGATLKEINAALSSGAGVDMLKSKYTTLSQAIENTKQKLAALKSAEQAMAEGVKDGTVSVNEQKQYQNEIARTEIKLKQYEGQLEQTRKKLNDNAAATDKADEETKQFDTTLQQAGKSALSFGDIFKANVFSDLVVNGIRRAKNEIIDFTKESVQTASDLAEVQNVVDVTFGENAQVINEWAKEAGTAFGMSELAAKQYAGTLGAMLKSSGIAENEVTGLSQSIVQLAGDMASFYNLDISASFEKIRAGIAGETEPLRQLGINMSVANLEAYALSQGIETAWKNMSQSEQVMLRYNYLMAQTADAQGDFARTSDSLANQQRIAKLNMEQIQAALGEKLIPIVNQLTGTLNENMPSIGDGIEKIGDIVIDLTSFVLDNREAITNCLSAYIAYNAAMKGGAAVMSAVNAFKSLSTAIKSAETAQQALNAVTNSNPYVFIASVVLGAAAAIGTYVYQMDAAVNSSKELSALSDDIIAKSRAEAYEVENKAKRYKQLYEQYKETGEAGYELKQLAEELQALSPETIKLIDEETGAYNELGDSINNVIDAIRRKGIEQAKQEVTQGRYDNIAEYMKQQVEAEQKYIKKMSDIPAEVLADLENGNTKKYTDFFEDPDNFDKSFKVGDTDISSGLFESWYERYVYASGKKNSKLKKLEDKIKAEQAEIESIDETFKKLYGEEEKLTEEASAPGAAVSDAMAKYYEKRGKAAESDLKTLEDYETDLEEGLKSIEEQYNKHRIVDADGNQDEAEYFRLQREYLQEHCNKTSEIWWKHWDDLDSKEKQRREKQKTESEKAAKDAQTKRDEILKDGLDAIQAEYESTSVPEEQALKAEGDYLLKRRAYLQEHCDETSDVWKKYWTEQLKEEKKYRDKLSDADKDAAKEEAEAWEKAFDDLIEKQKKAHDELTKQKEKAYEELSGIDLTSTVTGADGKEKTILTDLNAAAKKLTEY